MTRYMDLCSGYSCSQFSIDFESDRENIFCLQHYFKLMTYYGNIL